MRYGFIPHPVLSFALLTLDQFYRSLMEWATDIYLVSLLEEYLMPRPRIAGFVRTQLMTLGQKDDIAMALRHVTKLWRTTDTPYDALLNHTCLDWNNQGLVTQVSPDLRSAMFDLMLVNQTRRLLLSRYSDVHAIRGCIEAFIVAWSDELEPHSPPMQLWWDGVSTGTTDTTLHKPWVSKGLRGDADFIQLLQGWDDDNKYLQNFLREFERTTTLSNNDGPEGSRVFSEETAMVPMECTQVRYSGV